LNGNRELGWIDLGIDHRHRDEPLLGGVAVGHAVLMMAPPGDTAGRVPSERLAASVDRCLHAGGLPFGVTRVGCELTPRRGDRAEGRVLCRARMSGGARRGLARAAWRPREVMMKLLRTPG
jgi:hypothetical protein